MVKVSNPCQKTPPQVDVDTSWCFNTSSRNFVLILGTNRIHFDEEAGERFYASSRQPTDVAGRGPGETGQWFRAVEIKYLGPREDYSQLEQEDNSEKAKKKATRATKKIASRDVSVVKVSHSVTHLVGGIYVCWDHIFFPSCISR